MTTGTTHATVLKTIMEHTGPVHTWPWLGNPDKAELGSYWEQRGGEGGDF
jgi:hypothetical protein